MTLRLLVKKSYSRLARSGSLLCASAPAARPFSEGRVRSLYNAFSGVAHPSPAIPNNNGLHGLALRYMNTYICPRDPVTSSCSRIGVTLVNISHGMKSASLRPATGATGVGRTFSSKTAKNDRPSIESQIKASGDHFRRNLKNASNVFVVFGVLYCGALIHNHPR